MKIWYKISGFIFMSTLLVVSVYIYSRMNWHGSLIPGTVAFYSLGLALSLTILGKKAKNAKLEWFGVGSLYSFIILTLCLAAFVLFAILTWAGAF